uniref:phosphatidate phosphatase n=1 Tax=Scleropages formosus TaxID=113540 RepID=A0A8C9TWP6_SCLFO
MNYVGQLAGQMFVQVKELYRGLNPTTLSGCIDVIVVRQPDGTLQCSPFHVRFGKMGVLRSRGGWMEPVNLHMKLGENGEAFFVKETEEGQEVIPSYLTTSPILTEGATLMEAQLSKGPAHLPECGSGPSVLALCAPQIVGDNGILKKRRKRRKRNKADSLKKEDSGDESEDEDMFTIDMSSDEDKELDSSCPKNSRSETPNSDSELVTKPSKKDKQDNPEMLWTWGELPHAAKVLLQLLHGSLSRNGCKWLNQCGSIMGEQAPVESLLLIPAGPELQEGATVPTVEPEVEGRGTVASLVSDDGDSPGSLPVNKTDSPSKRKEKRSRHLGADGVYLDDITGLEPEVAALYFPKRDGAGRSRTENAVRSVSPSPQSIGSSGMDSGIDSFSEHLGDLPSIAISLCGGLTDNKEITKEKFQEKAVSYQQFSENPTIIDDPNLVVKIGTKYYNWITAAPLMLAMQAFQKPLPKGTVESIIKEKMPKKGGRWWFSWRGRSGASKPVRSQIRPYFAVGVKLIKLTWPSPGRHESSSSDDEHPVTRQSTGPAQPEVMNSSGTVSYQKTLRLTSEQLRNLQLKDGPNDVVFSVTTQYQGTCRCEGTIYLWNWDDKIVISDIDGTITRSDTLGHILPTLGKDWTHQGIARLYHLVSQNGYKFVYCSARAIGMADMTRGYLHWVTERGAMLPKGPVLLSPSSLFSALHREVIEKKPEKFKIECLTDIKNLFYPNTEPFYAAFGNRATDAYTYKEVGVSLNRIFTVNPKGELIQEHAKTNISSYGRLCEMVDQVFPLITRGEPLYAYQGVCWTERPPRVDARSEWGGFG